MPKRRQEQERFDELAATASHLAEVLRLAAADVRANPDDREVRNVIAFAQTHGRRLAVQIERGLSGMP